MRLISTTVALALAHGADMIELDVQRTPGTVALKAWTAPVVAEAVPLSFRQSIGADEPLRTGAYTSTLTFTVSTTAP
ncbi:hypothetical protein [Solirubrobacter soli]|uniref:hypothetical protein n=1 Tax=Solirubrobacter soli TaxID=363832 RepID=UPI000424813B|nr:hypothetical protein [Solirubrobacter soli]